MYMLKRGHSRLPPPVVWRLDHHHRICIQRRENHPQCRRLLRTGHLIARRPFAVVVKLIVIVKKAREPLNIVGRDAHQACLPEIVSHARLMSIMRFSAILMASSGKPRATKASG